MKYTLSDHIEKSFERLSKKDYLINDLLNGDGNWPGDWEGRALLAFCSLYSCYGKRQPLWTNLSAELTKY